MDTFIQSSLLFLSISNQEQILKGILIAEAVTSALDNPISHFTLPLRITANISQPQVPADPH